MADVKISELDPAPNSLTGAEVVALVQGGDTYSATTAQIAALAGGDDGGGGGGGDPVAILSGIIRMAQADGSANVWSSDNSRRLFGMLFDGAVGTASAPTFAPSGSLFGALPWLRYTSSSSTGNSAGIYSTTNWALYRSPSGAAEGVRGGLTIFWRFALGTVRPDQRVFVGLHSAFGQPTANTDPSAYTNVVGIAKDEADSSLHFIHNDGTSTATKVDTEIAVSGLADKVLELTIQFPRGPGDVSIKLYVADDDIEESASLSTDLPLADTVLYPACVANTGGTTGTAVVMNINKFLAYQPGYTP